MDIFQIDGAGLSLSRANSAISIDENASDPLPEVSFDRGPEFNLNFFESREDSNTQGGYSDLGSVESIPESTSPPPHHASQLASTPVGQFIAGAIDSSDPAIQSPSSSHSFSSSGQNAILCSGEWSLQRRRNGLREAVKRSEREERAHIRERCPFSFYHQHRYVCTASG